MALRDLLGRGSGGRGFTPTPFRWEVGDALAAEHAVIARLLEEATSGRYESVTDLKAHESGQELRVADAKGARRLALALLRWQHHIAREADAYRRATEDTEDDSFNPDREYIFRASLVLGTALQQVMRRKLPMSEADLGLLLDWIETDDCSYWLQPIGGVVKLAARLHDAGEVSGDTRARLLRLSDRMRRLDREERRRGDQLRRIFETEASIELDPGEAWSDAALADLDGNPRRREWAEVLGHAATAKGGKPSKKWIATAKGLLDAVGRAEFAARVARWFPLVDKPRTVPLDLPIIQQEHWHHRIAPRHEEVLKGLVWMCSRLDEPAVNRAVGSLAVSAYRRLPGSGPRHVALGNACVWSLGAMPGENALGQLALLRVRVKFKTAQKGIDKALAAMAERLGVPRDEVEEIGMPTYGLTEVGRREKPVGDFTAIVALTGSGAAALTFRRADGKVLKSVPKAVREHHADALGELKTATKDLRKMVPAQRERIDSLFLSGRSWPWAPWRERYLDHPLVGVLARRLIWSCAIDDVRVDVAWFDGALRDRAGLDVTARLDGATVSLWHPIDRPAEEVLAWRAWLEEREITQPFKQAHREIYLLTDAERETRTYSNRFAAHVLRQHQFNALCAAREWNNKLRLMVDDEYPPAHRPLPAWGLRAEFWIEGLGDAWGTDCTESGAFIHLGTDQVRFYPIQAPLLGAHASGGGYRWGRWRGGDGPPEPVPLAEIPPLVLSETLRDVDLFVGVASVGNDPLWEDGGAEGRHREYWQAYAFGDLSETAKTRRDVLARMLPRLKIADRCRIDDRSLVVRGDRATYRIHLGSGNIMIAPDTRYLCIVPSSAQLRKGGEVFLPFEGDRTLSIILSKAFLLADDTRITDPSIVRQIEGKLGGY